uniref:Uncharacterized protein n=1 Tax=Paramoeba aestuarina TaxID=180227 RepID=A0A7S4PLV9_9EUKA|mmetsp:Transcript_8788/g.13328  ORF Transcript_8788/g.13328 Transcript_8788/m.13328 type:complete len:261 (+) Transcript_8788:205-987(+)|eukprot:CAMPEP_0201520178 /NCGR_PEP_ID=MMETSP0161_2-20130828/10542_1 /ASSEMBLY_ACC=CAM_ASM_000251 /TAXON_ID=180227 /ORGANISM="Neoparamoeba aestuarina, Strain SoJaBio B1-5/56/2" /LENGTH=260 /DNA_ID=CAMNT_0047918459 /DNA_START=257 /DNA_END=1039 /DNA_ORIENTATION=+
MKLLLVVAVVVGVLVGGGLGDQIGFYQLSADEIGEQCTITGTYQQDGRSYKCLMTSTDITEHGAKCWFDQYTTQKLAKDGDFLISFGPDCDDVPIGAKVYLKNCDGNTWAGVTDLPRGVTSYSGHSYLFTTDIETGGEEVCDDQVPCWSVIGGWQSYECQIGPVGPQDDGDAKPDDTWMVGLFLGFVLGAGMLIVLGMFLWKKVLKEEAKEYEKEEPKEVDDEEEWGRKEGEDMGLDMGDMDLDLGDDKDEDWNYEEQEI